MGRDLQSWFDDGVEVWSVHETVTEEEGQLTPSFQSKTELIEHLVTKGTDWDKPWSRDAAEHFVNHSGWSWSLIPSKDGMKKGYEVPNRPALSRRR